MAPVYVEKTFAPLPGLQFRALDDARVAERIRVINEHCLAVKYTDSFYDTYVRKGLHVYNQLAYYHDILVGSITCRLEPATTTTTAAAAAANGSANGHTGDDNKNNNSNNSGGGGGGAQRLYIMTLCVLEAYRGMGIGARLLQKVLSNVQRETTTRISAVVLHAQVGARVLDFYAKFNFVVVERIKDYYHDLDERDALLLQLVVPQPHLRNNNNNNSSSSSSSGHAHKGK